MLNLLSLLVPIAYIAILTTSLTIFSSLYKRRQATKAASLAPWFSAHLQREIYLNLLYLDPSNPTASNPQPLPPTPASPSSPVHIPQRVPLSILKAALLHRAVEDVSRVLALQKAKPALASLLAQGKVGDDLWQRFVRAEQEMEEEIRDVVAEANILSSDGEGAAGAWGQYIFQSASEMQANGALKKDIFDIQAQMVEDREYWEQRQRQARSEFMDGDDDEDENLPKNLRLGRGGSAARAAEDSSDEEDEGGVTMIHVPSTAAASTTGLEVPGAAARAAKLASREGSRSRSRAGSAVGSEDDAVLVEVVGKGRRRKGKR